MGVLPFCRGAVGLFYSPSRGFTGHSLGEYHPLRRCSWCILPPQPTRPQDTRWGEFDSSTEKQTVYSTAPADWATRHSLGEVLLLCREAVGVFYSPNRVVHRTLAGEVLSLAEEQSVYFTAPADCASGLSLKESYTFTVKQSVYSNPHPTDWATRHSFGWESYPSAEKQPIDSQHPRWGSLGLGLRFFV